MRYSILKTTLYKKTAPFSITCFVKNKKINRLHEKKRQSVNKSRLTKRPTQLLSLHTLKIFCVSTVILGASKCPYKSGVFTPRIILGALECRSGGGFHALAGCVAYLCTRAVRKCGETQHQRCYDAPSEDGVKRFNDIVGVFETYRESD